MSRRGGRLYNGAEDGGGRAMFLAHLWQTVEVRLRALRRRWWPPGPAELLRDEAKQLRTESRATEAALAESAASRDALRQRITDTERRAARLTAQVADCVRAGYEAQAWPFALELDEVQKALAADRAQLRRHEQACWSYEFHLRQLRRRQQDVGRRLRRPPSRR